MNKKVKQIVKKWTAVALSLSMMIGSLQLSGLQAQAEEASQPSLKAAVLSDVHVRASRANGSNAKWFEHVLRWYKAQDVDAVIIAGDLANDFDTLATTEGEITTFFEVWKEVFPEAKGSAGYVEPIFIYGNHDKLLTKQEVNGVSKYWENNLGETFSPVYSKQVGGYWFVCVHEGLESANQAEIKKQVDAAVAASNGAPVFYVQHCALYQTTGGSDGTEYGDVKSGYEAIKGYENVIALSGHTHRSITDEASIWQGEDWEDGKFTAITCSTLDYASFDETGAITVSQLYTKQGMLMTAAGNDIMLERYNFYTDEMINLVNGTDTEADYSACVTSAGDDWKFTVGGEKPYTYDARYEASATPEFSSVAVATVVTADTSATITFPKAVMTDGKLFKDYVVEARDTRTGIVKATGLTHTEYTIDADTSRYSDTYTVEVSGLLENTEYDFYVYGTNFFGKGSTKPLVVTGKTTGTRTSNSGEKGDVNNNYYTDVCDLIALKKNSTTAFNRDVDENGLEDSVADMNALRRLLLGFKSAVVDSSNDLIAQSTYQTGKYDAETQGYGHQTKVVNTATDGFEDSKEAFEFWALSGNKATPSFTLWFDEAQDWSGTNVLNFDYYSADTSTAGTRLYEIKLITGEHKVMSSTKSGTFTNTGWQTVSIARTELTNMDWTNVKGISFLVVFADTEGRYDGVNKSSLIIDNMHTSYEVVPDTDLLSHYKNNITVSGGELTVVNGSVSGNTASELSCEAHQVVLSGESATMDIPVSGNPARLDTISISAKLSAGTVTMQPYDASGALVGNAKILNADADKWTVNAFAASEFNYDGIVTGYRFTVSGAAVDAKLLLDDFAMTYQPCGTDTDYFATAEVSGLNAAKGSWTMQPYNTNGSNSALHIWRNVTTSAGAPSVVIELSEAMDMNDWAGITYDIMFGQDTYVGTDLMLYDESGTSIGYQTHQGEAMKWTRHCASDFISRENVDVGDSTKVKTIRIWINFGANVDTNTLCDVWLDNLQIVMKDTDDLLESGQIVTATDGTSWGGDYYFAGGMYYADMDKNYVTGDRSVVRISREANCGAGNPGFYIKLPTGIKLNQFSTISLDTWLSEFADVNIQVNFVDDNRNSVTYDVYTGAETSHSWKTYKWTMSELKLVDGKTYGDATMIHIRMHGFKKSANADKAVEVLFDNFKISESKLQLNTTYAGGSPGTVSEVSGIVHGRDDVVGKYVHTTGSWGAVNINDTAFKEGLTSEDSIRFYVYVDTGTNTALTGVTLGLLDNSCANRYRNNYSLTLNAWNEIMIEGDTWWASYLQNPDGLTMYLPSSGSTQSYTMYITGVEVLKFANKALYSNLAINHNSSTITLVDDSSRRVEVNTSTGAYLGQSCIMSHSTNDAIHRVKLIDDTYLRNEIEEGDTIEIWAKAWWFSSYAGTVSVILETAGGTTLGSVKLDVLDNEEWRSMNGSGWIKLTLDAETVQKYIQANDGLGVFSLRQGGVGSQAFWLSIGALTVVKGN